MNYDFRPSPDFVKGVKALAKRYPSLKSDLLQLRQSLEHNPEQGVDLGGGFRKIRMNIKSKGRGKAGGAMGFVEKHKDYITEAALYFDSKANPVFSLAYDGKEMAFLSDKEFEDYLVKATRYKAGLLRIATQEMLAMKERRISN